MVTMHVYEVRPRKDKRGVDLISDALPFGRPVVWRARRNRECNCIALELAVCGKRCQWVVPFNR